MVLNLDSMPVFAEVMEMARWRQTAPSWSRLSKTVAVRKVGYGSETGKEPSGSDGRSAASRICA
jgi:hypothetical protein